MTISSEGRKKLLYEQEQLPTLQNRVYDTEAEAKSCRKGNMRLVEDQVSGLVYNDAFRPELMVYDANYQNEQARSPAFQKHLESVSHIIDRWIGRQSLVEVGCGKGFFLEMLAGNGFDIAGFDPTYEGNNSRVTKQFFTPRVGIRANGLILRHVLEHIQNPFEFLLKLKEANGGSGKIYIEVPCFDWICERRAWFDVFYEHVNYFRLADFYQMFAEICAGGRLFGGQYLFIVGELARLRPPSIDRADRANFPPDFSDAMANPREGRPGDAAVWGAGSKGVIFSLLKARAGHLVKTVIDINPVKQGKYLPATGLLVQAPSDALASLPAGSTIYVMNSNYLDEIREMSGDAYEYVGIDHE